MSQNSDFIIIGGGIIGLLTARELSMAGANVTVIEQQQFGKESSWAGGGILLPLYPWRQDPAISRLVMQSLKLYPELARQLISSSQIDPELYTCGLMLTDNPDFDLAVKWCQQYQVAYQIPTQAQLDNFNGPINQPLWLPGIAQARNPQFLKSLHQELLKNRVNLIDHCALKEICFKGNKISHILTERNRFTVNQLVICTGAWTGQVFQQLLPGGIQQPEIAPVKGQMLLIDAEPGILPHMILSGDKYLIPRLDGKILVGSTVERDNFNKTPTELAKQQLYDFAVDLFPKLKNYPLVKHWAGLRPGTPHGIPYICQHPDIANLNINAGHFRNGLAMGPASAQLMVDLMLDRTTAIPAQPYQFNAKH